MPETRKIDGKGADWRELDLDRSSFMSWRRQRRLENLLMESGFVAEVYAKADKLMIRLKQSLHWQVESIRAQIDSLIEQSIRHAAVYR